MNEASLPPFRVDHVGSLVRPVELLRAFDAFEDGAMSAGEFRTLCDGHIRKVVALQEEIGLPAVTDGEFRRRSYSRGFFDAVAGLEQRTGPFHFKNDQGTTVPVRAGYAAAPLARKRPIVADDFRFLKSVAGRTAKATILSPTYFHFGLFSRCVDPKVYPDIDAFHADVVRLYREEMADLAAAGCTLLQLDEVPLAMLCDADNRAIARGAGEEPERIVDAYIGLINAVCDARPPGMTVLVHLCRGNRVGMWAASGGYEPIAERLFNELRADGFLLEFDSDRAGGFAPLRHLPRGKRALLGLVSTKRTDIEPADELKRKIDEAARHAPLERLGLCPQCGFAASALRGVAHENPMTADIQTAKLRRLVEVARDVWENN